MERCALGLTLSSLLLVCAPVLGQPSSHAPAGHAHESPPVSRAQAAGTLAGAANGPDMSAPRWIADRPLREGMARVRRAASALEQMERDPAQAAQVAAHADEIRAAVDFMFANCRLDAAPDAALHPLLAQLIGASRALKEQPADPAPLAVLHEVLDRYEAMFDEREALPAEH